MSLNHVNLILPSFLSNGILNIEIKNDFIRQFWGWHQNGWANKMWPLATSGAIIAGARVGGSGLVLPWLHYTPISETIRKIGPQKLCHMYVFLPKIENCFHFLQNEIFILCNHNSSKIWTIDHHIIILMSLLGQGESFANSLQYLCVKCFREMIKGMVA